MILDLAPAIDRIPKYQRFRYAKRLEDALWELADRAGIPKGHRWWRQFVEEAQAQGLSLDANGDPIPDGTWLLDVPQPSLDQVLTESMQAVRRKAAEVREAYATSDGLMGGTYEQKRQELIDWDAGKSRAYPYIEEEARERGVSEQTVADEIRARVDDWLDSGRINPKVEAIRRRANEAMRAAHSNGDEQGIRDARDEAFVDLAAL